ncbi:MAG: TolC family protein [Anaeromyxobacteraceae bacterium]
MAAARATVDANRASRNAAWAEYLPTVAAFGQHSWANSAGLAGGAETWLIGLSASWNLLDGGLRESKIRQNGAKLDEAEARLKKAENQVRDDVRQSLLDLDSARANAAKSKEQRDLAAENQRLVDVSYKAGAATAVEQADATAQLRTAEFGAQADELSARIAALKVQLAVGAKAPITQ